MTHPQTQDDEALNLLEAREACAGYAVVIGDHGLAAEYRAGELDDQFEVRAALTALRNHEGRK